MNKLGLSASALGSSGPNCLPRVRSTLCANALSRCLGMLPAGAGTLGRSGASVIFSIFLCLASVATAFAISPATLLQSATSDFRAGKFASASIKYHDLLKRSLTYPQLRDVLLSYCESALREGKLATAESLTVVAKEKLSDPPAIGRASFLRAEILYFKGDMKQAVDEYMDFLSGNTESPLVNDVIERLLLIDENGGDNGEPLVAYSRAEFLEFAGMPDSAAVALRKLLKSFPSSQIADDARMKIGDILSSRAKFSEAVEEYRVLESSLPKSQLVPLAKLKIAQLYLDGLREPDKATAEYESVVTGFPETSYAAEARGELDKLKAGSRGRSR
jgi:outer membrane protein assembly factor BamD (BamD/ComL family)